MTTKENLRMGVKKRNSKRCRGGTLPCRQNVLQPKLRALTEISKDKTGIVSANKKNPHQVSMKVLKIVRAAV